MEDAGTWGGDPAATVDALLFLDWCTARWEAFVVG